MGGGIQSSNGMNNLFIYLFKDGQMEIRAWWFENVELPDSIPFFSSNLSSMTSFIWIGIGPKTGNILG